MAGVLRPGGGTQEAVQGVRGIIAEEAQAGQIDLRSSIIVTDADGRQLFAVSFMNALAVHLPECAERCRASA